MTNSPSKISESKVSKGKAAEEEIEGAFNSKIVLIQPSSQGSKIATPDQMATQEKEDEEDHDMASPDKQLIEDLLNRDHGGDYN